MPNRRRHARLVLVIAATLTTSHASANDLEQHPISSFQSGSGDDHRPPPPAPASAPLLGLVSLDASARIFDGVDDRLALGLRHPDYDNDYVETCGEGEEALHCTLWQCSVAAGKNSECVAVQKSRDAFTREVSPEKIDRLWFVLDEALFYETAVSRAEAEGTCHENSGSIGSCAEDVETSTLHCSFTMCGITSYYVCIGDLEGGCMEYGDQSIDTGPQSLP